MGRHYSRIAGAARYQQALTNYVAFIEGKTNRQPGIGTGKKRDKSQILFVKPFGAPAATSDLFQVSASQTAWVAHEGSFGSHALATLPSGGAALRVRGFRPARVVIVTGRQDNGVVKESHITKQKYLSYGGTSRSIPFGKAAAGDTELGVYDTIRGLLVPTGSTVRAYLSPERI